jgi:Pyruvate/2-oxoacid:ferredoxin oxidoreductase delta subunit
MKEAESDAAVEAAVEKDNDSKEFGVGYGAREIMGMEAVEDRNCHGCGVCPQEAGKDLVWF